MISDEGNLGLGDLHQTLQDGERVVIRRARPLYIPVWKPGALIYTGDRPCVIESA